MTTLRYSLSPSQVKKESRIRRTEGWSRVRRISSSRFLYFLSWQTRLMATNSNVFLSRALWTTPNVPDPTLSSQAYLAAPTSRLDSRPSRSPRTSRPSRPSDWAGSFLAGPKMRLAASRCACEKFSRSLASVLSLEAALEGGLRARDLMGFCFLRVRVSLSLKIFLFSARGARVLLMQTLIFLPFSFISVLIRRLGASSFPPLPRTFSFRLPIILNDQFIIITAPTPPLPTPTPQDLTPPLVPCLRCWVMAYWRNSDGLELLWFCSFDRPSGYR